MSIKVQSAVRPGWRQSIDPDWEPSHFDERTQTSAEAQDTMFGSSCVINRQPIDSWVVCI